MPVHRPRICHRCKRPLRETQGYKRIEGRFTNYYCDEHVVLMAHGWRLLEPGEVPPPPVGSAEAAAWDALASSPPWDDTEPPLPVPPASPDDAYEAPEPMRHVGTFASVPPKPDPRDKPWQKDFDPLNDVGF